MALSQDKHPATTHPFELPYNGTVLPRFPYYTNQLPYLLQIYIKYNNHHPYSNLSHQEPNPHPENHSTLNIQHLQQTKVFTKQDIHRKKIGRAHV